MKRTRATALVLVNWKGVFYERYVLDRHVTSLEGANGAGKTTVMIAAYVVLMPDMSRLRFTNLGENAATGGDRGIWGRLGEPGRPAYAALELELAEDERVVLGVELERKAEPSVEPKPFLVTGLAPGVRLQDLFLIQNELEESVPELRELTANAEKLGAKVESFRSTREYFDALFERGITALRLASEEERGKLNEMLRTSMTGGISRALSSELRTFLFQKETGLSDALSRMRANLDTCRRSRSEVLEAQRLERELSSLVEAAEAWLGLALRAANQELVERRLTLEALRSRRELALDSVQSLGQASRAAEAKERAAKETLDALNQERTRLHVELERGRLFRECRARVTELEARALGLAENLERARTAREALERSRAAARRARSEAQDALGRAASGLLRLQTGLEELERRAHAHRAFRERLVLAQSLLETTIELDAVEPEAEKLRTRLRELDAEHARVAREIEAIAHGREDFERAFAALTALRADVTPESAFEHARLELGRAFELEALREREGELEREYLELQKRQVRRSALEAQALSLGLRLTDGDAFQILEAAWNEAEAELVARGQALTELSDTLRDSRERERALEGARRALEPRVRAFQERARKLGELAARLGESIDFSSADGLVRRLERELSMAREGVFLRRAERERALERALRLEATEGSSSAELVRLAAELDAELTAQRFDDLEPEAARAVEARLGPLVDSLVVLDPEATARALAGAERDLAEVLLISPEVLREKVDPDALSLDGPDVLVEEHGVFRVTRKPETSRLGRRARAARAAELRERAAALEVEIEQEQRNISVLGGLLRDLERILAEGVSDEERDPSLELASVEAELGTVQSTLTASREALGPARESERLARERVAALRSLVAKGAWLAEPTSERAAEDVLRQLESSRAARAELERTEHPRRVLTSLIDALRHVPLSPTELERRERERAELTARRDRCFLALSTLEYLIEHRGAAAFQSAESALAAETAIVPSLEAEHERSRTALDEAEQALEAIEHDWEKKTRELQQAEAEQLASAAWLAREREELARLDGAEDTLAEAQLSELTLRFEATTREERSAAREAVLLAERSSREQAALRALDTDIERLAAELQPLEARIASLRSRVEPSAGTLRSAATREDERKSSELWAEMRGKRELLLERLGRVRGASELAAKIVAREAEGTSGVEGTLEAALEGFLLVRDWLAAHLPQHTSPGSDGLYAVTALRRHLGALEERLARHEHDLRFASEDLARGIEVRLRRAQGQVRRLNQHLTGIRFGSIRGIRIRSARVERMDQVLRALREGATQELLFQPDLPIEEALNEIFRRHGGGKNGAERLLDYREYLELAVEIAREEGGDFEVANPTRLSTGEAIGVGAALMMVVLTEWERDANLLRGKRALGSLRFLFLDEANRLSQDNLGVLFDLCQTLDLQLLIAAPEVARAEGNTTYRLVRQRIADGREQVIVSGRRGLAS